MTDDREGDGGGKQVVARAVSVLEALEGQASGLSLGDIAKATGLPKSTVQRLVGALEARRFVVAGAAGVRLGSAITRLAASIHTDVVAISAPFIEAASRRLRETVDLSVFRGSHAMTIFQYASDRELRVVSPVWAAFPLYCTAHGKAILSTLEDDEIRRLVSGHLDARNPRTITDMQALLDDIASVRRTGFALDDQEHEEGVCGIGVILECRTDEQHALSIAVPSVRFERQLSEIKGTLLKCKAEIEAQFG
ncbi:IclR family transcriptional regulator [Burkholderia sp. MSh2]|uniref:IclR family transcriptional regulator n=1 Tax=Burkholderia paludis TaxID=1506587 RepID=A0A6P2QWN3_9BURK|nr:MULTISPECIES: IclR family transcriptional regulator [Burkholderia]KEZ02199.1 IclR family transcriptional regulator [Burkholderia sp. MSh2]CAB3771551.1 HTH-type transcriptional regulator SrpS [Burkholderia paludis]VWC28372.1 IclR family transcriptional regulator [Burkholderia paludis]